MSAGEGWSCGMCTFFNENASFLACGICGAERPSDGNVVMGTDGPIEIPDDDDDGPPVEVAEEAELDSSIEHYRDLFLEATQLFKSPESKVKSGRSAAILMELFRLEHQDTTDAVQPMDEGSLPTECSVCAEDEGLVTSVSCMHCTLCADCFRQNVMETVKQENVLPWIRCPMQGCKAHIHPFDFDSCAMPAGDVLTFVRTVMRKKLAQDDRWVECKKDDCQFGFLLPPPPQGPPSPPPPPPQTKKKGKKAKAKAPAKAAPKKELCLACGTKQVVEKEVDVDDELQKLIKKGELRPCPKCTELTMKDYGMCNVMQCQKCGVWWNWRTRETGSSNAEMKRKARFNGSLWEPGELNYQRNLEYSDPEAFKRLLEKNGIKYDPNYRRGQ